MTSFKPNCLSEAPLPNTITFRGRAAVYEFWVGISSVYCITIGCISGSKLQTYNRFGRLGILLLQNRSETLFACSQVLMGKSEGQLFLWVTQELGVFLPLFTSKGIKLRLHITLRVITCESKVNILQNIRASQPLEFLMHDNLRLI